MEYKESYLPVDPDFLDTLKELNEQSKSGKVHFFDTKGEVNDAQGNLSEIKRGEYGEFALVDNTPVRLDKIITIFGKPGPAYDEYDSYANACLTCEDIGQF